MRLKLVWYNVLRGFHKKEKDGSLTFQTKRLELARQIISQLDADTLFLGEADFNPLCDFRGKNTSQINYREEFRYPYSFYARVTSRKGEAVLSKIPLKVRSFSTEEFPHIRTILEVERTKIMIDLIQPYPLIAEKEKAEFVKKILKTSQSPYILLGDFNALSSKDKYNLTEVAAAFGAYKSEDADKRAKEAIRGLAIKEIESHGLVDTFRLLHTEPGYTYPTRTFSKFKGKKPILRLDYIFCSREFKVLESECVQNTLTHQASDHYPLYAVLEI